MSHVDPRFAAQLRALRTERRLSLRALGQLAHRGKSHLHDLETGARHTGRLLHSGQRTRQRTPQSFGDGMGS
ncbi:helix-turn-helix domain-containing protein [Micromonospora sp. NPDC051925]|uniref:helix-turn-helix domain-containing protein n=1 Tax=Micromonospora sp. NPDC051925 TaxID=3364288 RepID=UPI0037CB8BCB